MQALQRAVGEDALPVEREAGLVAYAALAREGGRPAEPFLLPLLPAVLACHADKVRCWVMVLLLSDCCPCCSLCWCATPTRCAAFDSLWRGILSVDGCLLVLHRIAESWCYQARCGRRAQQHAAGTVHAMPCRIELQV